MAEMASAAGLPRPEIEDAGGTVAVRFRRGQPQPPKSGPDTSPAERKNLLLALLDRADDGLTRREIHFQLRSSLSERQVRRVLEELRDEGLVAPPGRGRWARWKRRAGGRLRGDLRQLEGELEREAPGQHGVGLHHRDAVE